jgi:hypothetical protein
MIEPDWIYAIISHHGLHSRIFIGLLHT